MLNVEEIALFSKCLRRKYTVWHEEGSWLNLWRGIYSLLVLKHHTVPCRVASENQKLKATQEWAEHIPCLQDQSARVLTQTMLAVGQMVLLFGKYNLLCVSGRVLQTFQKIHN